MSDQPTTPTTDEDPELVDSPQVDRNNAAKQSIRVIAIEHASRLSSQETPVEEFLSKATQIEDYLLHGPEKKDG